MGFTVEDMMVVSQDRYQMELIAGKNGWSNSISWVLMLEEITITHNFAGKELAVTTGLGFMGTDKLMALARQLVSHHASGLLINTGRYIKTIPDELSQYCDANDLPLLTVPWDVVLADLIKDLSMRIFLQADTDSQISASLIAAIENPDEREEYSKPLLPHFDIDGTFQVILLFTGDLDRMDTVDRRRLSYRLQLYLSNITHNGHFFYYDSVFVLVINALEEEVVRDIVRRFMHNIRKRMPDREVRVGISDIVSDISTLQTAYRRARAALSMALDFAKEIVWFSDMGLYRMLYLVTDRQLLTSMSEDLLRPLLDYDTEHQGAYLETLEHYLKADGSIKAAADALFTHRNTVSYRMNNIRRLLNCCLETQEEKTRYLIACMITHMYTI